MPHDGVRMKSFSNQSDSADIYNRPRTLLLSKAEPPDCLELAGGRFLHPDSALRQSGEEFLLSWDFFEDEGGIPKRARAVISQAFLRLGAATFSYQGSWTDQFTLTSTGQAWTIRPPLQIRLQAALFRASLDTRQISSTETQTWLVKTSIGHRLRVLLLNDRAPRAWRIRKFCTTEPGVFDAEQLSGWQNRYEGYVVITRQPLGAETWDWRKEKQFTSGMVDDRGGEILSVDPVSIVIPGADAETVWIWCANGSVQQLREALATECAAADLQFRAATIDDLRNRFSYLPRLPSEYARQLS